MKYEKLQPPDYLKGYVRYFWTLESKCIDHSPKTFRIVADGCPGLMFQQSKKDRFYQNNKQLPELFLYGQATKHSEIYSTGNIRAIGVCLYPNALKSVFGFDANELTDSCTDLNVISEQQGFYLSERLSNDFSVTSQIETISSYLFFQLEKNNSQTDDIVRYALSQITKAKGSISLKELQKDLRLSERSFERRFKQCVGIPPKLFSRICRFQASLKQLRKNNFNRLSDIAYQNDYADQSHLIRSFQEFAGFSPYQYQKQSNEVIENFSELKK